jgi:Ankyrin repeats (many copies)
VDKANPYEASQVDPSANSSPEWPPWRYKPITWKRSGPQCPKPHEMDPAVGRIEVRPRRSRPRHLQTHPHQQNYLVRVSQRLTSLHIASRFALSDFVRFLLADGADINTTDAYGRTPPCYLLEWDQFVIRPSRHPAPVRAPNGLPSADGVSEVVRVLLDSGAQVDFRAMSPRDRIGQPASLGWSTMMGG